MRALFNKSGNPLVIEFSGAGGSAMGYTSGGPSAAGNVDVEKKRVIITENSETEKFSIGGDKLISWGENNDFPQKADLMIGKTGVLNTGLKFLRNLTLGQGSRYKTANLNCFFLAVLFAGTWKRFSGII